MLAAVQLVPIVAFSLGGGTIADPVDRRRLMLITAVGLAASSLGLLALSLMPPPPLLALYAVAFVAASLWAVD